MSQSYGSYVPNGIKHPPKNLDTWILHAEMQICGTNFWFADDVLPITKGNSVRLTTTVSTAEAARRIFNKLQDNGIVTLPPTEAFYTTFHAAVTDKYGIHWNIVAEEEPIQKT
ncbi:VOC family protein [Bacillus sp. J14TS2]|uniref:VOC family protein n=1 Tax=Bacillus sp. J14TS2 TaxID=2807188 RepID=UPI001B0254AC|nr:VOC family protein [Bacillus sp. J14TS2]GIN73383.1 VOC family protein [Bacillus sp. J14TS2]